MTSWQRALLLVGIAVALALVSLWSGDEPPAPAHVAQPVEVATETAQAVAAGASAPAGRDDEADGARVEASTPASASRSLTVTVEGEVPTTPDGLQVALLFGQRYESELRLRVGRKGTATWTSGDGVAWPAAVDFAFPSRGNSFVDVGEAPRAVLNAPPTCVLKLEVVEADGLPSTEPMTASVRVPGARPPADRAHELAVVDGCAVILAEATGALMEVEVRTSSGRSVQGAFSAARENGEEVECKVALSGQQGVPLQVSDLPPGDEPWRVDFYASAEHGPVRAPRAGGVDDVRAEFDRIFQRFEEMGLDVPSRRFFDDPFFRDLESQFGRGLGLPGAGSGQGMSVQIGPDVVRVEVAEQGEDGKSETKVYEAPDMETFQEKYPGVLKGNGLRLGLGDLDEEMKTLRGRIGKLERGFDWDLAEPRVLRLPRPGLGVVPPPAPPAPGRRLGVTVKSIPGVLRDYLELGDAGLMVETVQDDSLAAACGLRADDIVVKIGDREIASPADVAAALGAIKKGDEVRVDFVRRGRKETAKTAKRFDAEALERQPALRKREKLR